MYMYILDLVMLQKAATSRVSGEYWGLEESRRTLLLKDAGPRPRYHGSVLQPKQGQRGQGRTGKVRLITLIPISTPVLYRCLPLSISLPPLSLVQLCHFYPPSLLQDWSQCRSGRQSEQTICCAERGVSWLEWTLVWEMLLFMIVFYLNGHCLCIHVFIVL